MDKKEYAKILLSMAEILLIFFLFQSISLAQSDMCVEGVIMGGERLVVINGRVLEEGESINGTTISNITKDEVYFGYKGQTYIREIGQGCESKKPIEVRKKKISKRSSEKLTVDKKPSKPLRYINYKKAKKNYKEARKCIKKLEDLTKDSYGYNKMVAKAFIYYKKGLKNAQWAFSYMNYDRRNELKKIIRECRAKKADLEDEKIRIASFSLPFLRNTKDISKWMRKNIEYESDYEVHGKDYWQTPRETVILGAGDCEDAAFLAQALLRQIDIDSNVISIQFKKRNGEKSGHAICVFPSHNPRKYFSNGYLRTSRKGIKNVAKDWLRRDRDAIRWTDIDEIDISTRDRKTLFER